MSSPAVENTADEEAAVTKADILDNYSTMLPILTIAAAATSAAYGFMSLLTDAKKELMGVLKHIEWKATRTMHQASIAMIDASRLTKFVGVSIAAMATSCAFLVLSMVAEEAIKRNQPVRGTILTGTLAILASVLITFAYMK